MNLYPAGSLGNSTWEADLAELDVELAYGLTLIEPDLALATTAVEAVSDASRNLEVVKLMVAIDGPQHTCRL